MAINSAKRASLSTEEFGLPDQRKYPVDTPGRARNAVSRASQQEKAGRLSPQQEARIAAKAHRALATKFHEPVKAMRNG